MKKRVLLAGALLAGLVSGAPALVHADAFHHPRGAYYGEYHEWHPAGWWLETHPKWVRAHHPEWARNGDWDERHHWHDRSWRIEHHRKWAHEHHHDWF